MGRREGGGETRALFHSSVPLCSPAVGTPTGTTDVMSEFDHLSSTPLTHIKIHTLTLRGSNPTNGCPLTHSSKAGVSLWMHSRPPRAPDGPRRDLAGYHITSAHCSNWPPMGVSVRWHVDVAGLWVSLYLCSESPLFSSGSSSHDSGWLLLVTPQTTNRTFHHPFQWHRTSAAIWEPSLSFFKWLHWCSSLPLHGQIADHSYAVWITRWLLLCCSWLPQKRDWNKPTHCSTPTYPQWLWLYPNKDHWVMKILWRCMLKYHAAKCSLVKVTRL